MKQNLKDHQKQTTRWSKDKMRLKIRKTKSGTYYIPGLSIKQIKKLAKNYKLRWSLQGEVQDLRTFWVRPYPTPSVW